MERDGWRFIGPAGSVTAALWGLTWLTTSTIALIAGILLTVVTAFLAFFFRDPERVPPNGERWVVAPADGKVLSIDADADCGSRVAIFLSVFDVHVNRAPVEGVVRTVEYRPGRFLKAYNPRAATENERVLVTIDTARGSIELALIAGILARRVVCRVKPGQRLMPGQRIGLIRFGSRAEVVIPLGATVLVNAGDRVKGGETPLARFEGSVEEPH